MALKDLGCEGVFYLLCEEIAAKIANGLSERQLLGTGLNTVLSEATLLNAAVACESAETVFPEDCSGRSMLNTSAGL
jgi:hypothetical protein